MSKTILRKNNAHLVRIIAGFAAFVAIIFCGFKIATAVKYSAITVSETNGNITVNNNTINGLTITPALVFNQTESSITYKVILSDPDQTPFQIKSITDDNTNQYVTTSYEYSHEKNSNEKPVLIKLSYSSYLPFGDELNLRDIHISIDVEDGSKEESEVTPANTPTNTPNTGSFTNSSKYLKTSSEKTHNQVLPYIIICVISISVIITVMPKSKRHRVQFNKITSIVLILIISGTAISTYAKSTKLEITIIGANISAIPDTSNPQEVVQIAFPNIYNNKVQDRDGQAPGNAIILKTLDNKYVLMDTGPNTEDVRNVIYNTLVKIQDNPEVIIDYLIISHLDSDHYANATRFINNENITIRNVVLKHERSKETAFSNITEAAANNNVNIITSGDGQTREYLESIGVTDYDKISEGMVLNIGKYLKLDFFNTSDVYQGKDCPSGHKISWTASTSSSNYIKTSDDKYIYFDGSEYETKQNGEFALTSSKYPYADVTLKTTSNLVAKENGSGMNRYFYAVDSGSHSICQSNPNAFGILAEVTTTGLKKYMYFPGDLENAGYSMLSSGANSSALFEDLDFENGEFIHNVTPYSIPSEDDTATAIYNKLASDASSLGVTVNDLLNNIVIYQESHHGHNNSEKAVWKLNINRASGIYAIEEGGTNMPTTASFNATKTYWYTLGNLPAENKIRVGDSTKDGVNCTINTIGTTICTQYEIIYPS